METKLIKITRTVTSTASFTIEVPKDLWNAEVYCALSDNADLADFATLFSDRECTTSESVEYDSFDTEEKLAAHASWENDDLRGALLTDQLIDEDYNVITPEEKR